MNFKFQKKVGKLQQILSHNLGKHKRFSKESCMKREREREREREIEINREREMENA